LSQLCAVMVKHETPDRWPALLQLLNQSTKSGNPHDRQVGLLLLNKVVESNPEPFKPHYKQLLQLFSNVLQEHDNPVALYYCILTITAITVYTGTEEMVRCLIVALRNLVKTQASEAMEVLNELMESEVSIIVPHLADIIRFCLEVGSDTSLSDTLRVKAFSCIAFLIKLKSKTVLKQKLLNPILHSIFPVLTAAPPPGQQDPEDKEDDEEDGTDNDNPKHSVTQIIDTMALHMPPEKLFQQLMPFTQECFSSDDSYKKKGGLLCLAVLAEGCADHIRTKMLSTMLQTVCRNLSDSDQVVRSAALFALGQFSEHLQPEVSKYCSELMPLLLGYLSSLSDMKVGHVTKAFYALENFMENLGEDIEPYLPTLMDTMLSALNNTDNMKIKVLSVSAIGAIANAAKDLLVPYFPPVIESLKGFLTSQDERLISSVYLPSDTLSVLARTIGKDVFGPLAAECVRLGLNLTDAIDDPDLRRCTFVTYILLFLSDPGCQISDKDIVQQINCIFQENHDETEEEEELLDETLEEDSETNIHDVAGYFSVENSFIDEKEDACVALGEIAFNTGAAFQPFMDLRIDLFGFVKCFLFFLQFPHEDVRTAAFGAMGQFCRAQHKVWKENPTEANHQALLKLLDIVLPCFLETVRTESERQVVMGVLESMNNVIKSCKEEAFKSPTRLKEISTVIRDVLKKKTVCQDGDDEAEYDAMLQEFAGEGIPLLAASVGADSFAPFLNDLLPLIMSKAKSSCTVAERSFSLGTIGEILQALTNVPGGQGLAGRLSNRLFPVLVSGIRDGDAEVRNNSVFGLGCLAEAAGPIVASDYPTMLSIFSNLLSKENDLRVIDNVCAALCRMIMANVNIVPLEQVSHINHGKSIKLY
uniref:Importin 4 n=1 Tax=Gouania willdenowi TaxID=441366 RepID=A0A8C5GNY9_GOUWI